MNENCEQHDTHRVGHDGKRVGVVYTTHGEEWVLCEKNVACSRCHTYAAEQNSDLCRLCINLTPGLRHRRHGE